MISNCLTMADLKAMPIRTLADIANNTEKGLGVRVKAAEALHARLPEMNGVGWLRLSDADHVAIKRAMVLDTASYVIQ